MIDVSTDQVMYCWHTRVLHADETHRGFQLLFVGSDAEEGETVREERGESESEHPHSERLPNNTD